MKTSKYIITKKLETGEIILFSSFSTALISLSEEIYSEIFEHHNYTKKDLVQQLQELGFLVIDDSQEQILERLRVNEMGDKTPVLKIFTTNKCNARCYYCFEKGIKQIDMEPETAIQVITFIKTNYPNKELQINWFGGEPLYNFAAIDYITTELHKDGYKLQTHITTNGSLISQEIIDFLKKYYDGISIQVTIDDIGIKYSKVKKYIDIPEEIAYQRIINNIHLLLTNNISTRIRINFLKSKIDYAFQVYNTLSHEFHGKNGLMIYFAPLSFDDDKADHEIEHTHLKLMEFYNSEKKVFDNGNEHKSLLTSLTLKPKSIPCGACRVKNFTITADGQLFKCHRIAKFDYCNVGNVWDGINIRSEYHQMFVSPDYISRKCKECNVYPICRGGCTVVTHILKNQDVTCAIYQKHQELIKMYYGRLLEAK